VPATSAAAPTPARTTTGFANEGSVRTKLVPRTSHPLSAPVAGVWIAATRLPGTLGSPTFASLDTCAAEGVPPAVALARQILPPAIQMAAYGSTPETAPLAGSYVPRWTSRSPPTLSV